MIQGNVNAVFPGNAVLLIQERLSGIDPDIPVFRRPLQPTDPVQCMSVFGTLWTPRQDSVELLGSQSIKNTMPSLQNYNITVQALVQDMDTERGLATHSVLSKLVRGVLYHDNPLHVGLGLLSSQMFGVTERYRRREIVSQRFMSNEISGNWLYLSVLDLRIETETV
jgi:hypothetical protein